MPSLNVLICGGGIAGPSLAHWLADAGHNVTIVERHPVLRASGAQIDLRAQGIPIIERMGVMDAVRKVLVDEEGFAEVDAEGRHRAVVLANKSGRGAQLLTSEFEIMRGDLVRVLYEHTKDRVRYEFGKSVIRFEEGDKSVVVHFSDETSRSFDVLVGADGQGSRIRKAILPKDEDPIRHFGLFTAGWIVQRTDSDSNLAKSYHSAGGRWILCRSSDPTRTQVSFSVRDESEEVNSMARASLETQKEYWRSRFRGAGWQTERFLAELDDSEYFYCQEICQVKTRTWSKGRVVLLGDAAHTPSPLTAMGTTGALVGAYILAGEITRHQEDLPTALANYDKILRPFVDECQKLSPWYITLAMPMTQLGVTVLVLVLQVLCWLKIPQIGARFAPQEKAGWAIPEYPELSKRKD